jgi:microcystin-dependent protein
VTSSQGFDSLVNMDGKVVAFVPHVTSGGGPVTLNVDGLGAKALRSAPGVELAAGTLISGTPYAAVYRNSSNEWLLRGFFGANPYNVPLGAGLPFFGTVAPNSSFAFPRGQPISRTTYSALFALLGTTYGAGDGATTFALPDLSGRLLACREGMEGAPAPGRITTAGSGIDGTALGATGGVETVTLATSQLPSHTHANTLNDPGHVHGVSDPTHAHSVSDPTHVHGLNDPTHSHSSSSLGLAGGGLSGFASGALAPGGVLINAAATGISIQAAATGVSVQGAATGVSVQSAATGASIVNAAQGGGLAHNNMPPIMMVNYIMRVL